MTLELNIYENGKVIKTYTASDFMLMTGTCEDIINIINIDKLTSGKLDDKALGFEIIKIVAKSFKKFNPFIKDIFTGLTDEEYRKTSVKEVGKIIFDVVKYTIAELSEVGDNKKN